MQKKIKNHKINWQVKFIVKANVYTYVKKKYILQMLVHFQCLTNGIHRKKMSICTLDYTHTV